MCLILIRPTPALSEPLLTDLSLYVHECDSVATVTDDKLVIALRQYVYGIDGDISLGSRQAWLECVSTLCGL